MPKRHFTIYSDESAKKGRYFSNFYGGALVKTGDIQAINQILNEKKDELNLFKELKWTKITENYQDKYIEFISKYFDLIEVNRIRVRVMFTHNQFRPKNLTEAHYENQYFILYYHFFKHIFGLAYSNPQLIDRISVALLLDQVPHNAAKLAKFKEYIAKLNSSSLFYANRVSIVKEQIGEIKSDDHVILQGLDIILGAMQFRLNDCHLDKPAGARRRGRRTLAKERVYKHVNKRIRALYPGFNIGTSTGCPNGLSDRWLHPYRHWKFVSDEYDYDESAVKERNALRKKSSPAEPY